MLITTYNCLINLHHRHGPREFGKICQKMLAISYHRAGFGHVVERGVQGVDLDAANGEIKYTTEVKTTISDSISFEEKDAAGLAARHADGYHRLLAVLQLKPLSDWLIVDAEYLEPGRLHLDTLRPYRRNELETQLRTLFAAVVDEHGESSLTGAQAYLDKVLFRLGVEQQDR
ncbi:MAG TPA: hypothetical protein VE988_17760 [Gemmataceae bacterium]|nr:hypothetical protein [Gemmataceae bacterium]